MTNKKLYTITDLARELEVTTQAIRLWLAQDRFDRPNMKTVSGQLLWDYIPTRPEKMKPWSKKKVKAD